MKAKKRFFSLIVFIFFIQILLVSVAAAATRIMPLGDSITYDNNMGDILAPRPTGERIAYRYRLWQLLTDAGYDFDFVGSKYAGYDVFPDAENEGWPGATDAEIASWIYDFLVDNPADIILLHIGTNGIDIDPGDVEDILDEIGQYETDSGIKIIVVLARIITRACCEDDPPCSECVTTTTFNDNVEDMAYLRVNDQNNPAYPDKIEIVDMEGGAGINYNLQPLGDMYDNLHPNEDGYAKMADVWFSELQEILPAADAGSDQSVDEGETVTLDGSNSNDPKFNPISSYYWTQTEGTTTTLSDPTVVQPTFTAPDAGSRGENLSFRLTVTYSNGSISTDNTGVNVNGSSSSSNDTGCFIGTASNGSLIP